MSDGDLEMWTITHRPRDLPGIEYAARLHLVRAGEIQTTDRLLTAASLEALRDALPPGLFRLHRFPEDDDAIVETWL
jgi:hypothetical protein